PALYNLIVDGQIIQTMMDGNFPEQAKALFMIVKPEAMEMLSAPMAESAARDLMALMPLELKSSIRESVLPGPTLTYALLSAHMIIFWLSQDSNVTPPVCLCGFTAAAIAKTPPMATGLASWKVAKGLYIVPLLFAYTAILSGSLAVKLEIFAFALVGLFAIACGLQGYMKSHLSLPFRILLTAAGTAMLWPGMIWVHLAGLGGFAVIWILHKPQRITE
ncbi:MAG: hypothetical protein MI802_22170, partial [Desulfobacterales bacterium]|nr:hypothetical protein [Desulfobacterales bacterium]